VFRNLVKRNLRSAVRGTKRKKGDLGRRPDLVLLRKSFRSFSIPHIGRALSSAVVDGSLSRMFVESLIEKLVTKSQNWLTKSPESTALAVTKPRVPYERQIGKIYRFDYLDYDVATKHMVAIGAVGERVQLRVFRPTPAQLAAWEKGSAERVALSADFFRKLQR